MIFNKQVWSSVKWVLRKTVKILREWDIICKEKTLHFGLELLIREPLKIGNA
jgi:hypothetical protein